jgi:hypothetical protein
MESECIGYGPNGEDLADGLDIPMPPRLPEPEIAAAPAPRNTEAGPPEPDDDGIPPIFKMPSPKEAATMRRMLARGARRQWPPALA